MSRSSPLLLYAVYDPSRSRAGEIAERTEMTGVAECPVWTVGSGSLAALASPIPSSAPWIHAPSVETVLTFKSVVDRAFAAGPVIPLRFGTVVDSASRASSILAKKHDHYRSLLGRLEGQVEMGLRLSLTPLDAERGGGDPSSDADEGADPGDRPGTSYLLARRHRMRCARERVERAVEPFRDGVASIITSMTTSVPEDADAPVSVAFLVPREQEAAFRSAVTAVTAPDVDHVDVVGPWPPYSFVQTTEA